jgi:hypothetical protein
MEKLLWGNRCFTKKTCSAASQCASHVGRFCLGAAMVLSLDFCSDVRMGYFEDAMKLRPA